MSSDIKIELQSARVIADGKEFGSTGCYEYLTGWIHFEIEPAPIPITISLPIKFFLKNFTNSLEFFIIIT